MSEYGSDFESNYYDSEWNIRVQIIRILKLKNFQPF